MCKSRFRFGKYCVFASTDYVENLWKISQAFGKLLLHDFFHPRPHPDCNLLCGNVQIFFQVAVIKRLTALAVIDYLCKNFCRQQDKTVFN